MSGKNNEVEQFSGARANDRAEITHRLYQFCRASDRKDIESARTAFHTDAYLDFGQLKGTFEDFVEYHGPRHALVPFCFHDIGTIFIEFTSSDEAYVESYMTIWQSLLSGGNLLVKDADGLECSVLTATRYVDQFTRREGAWRIQERLCVPDFTAQLPAGTSSAAFGAEWAKGTRDRDDPSWAFRARMGL